MNEVNEGWPSFTSFIHYCLFYGVDEVYGIFDSFHRIDTKGAPFHYAAIKRNKARIADMVPISLFL